VKLTVRTLDVHLAVPFVISRAVRTEKRVVLVELDEDERVSRGEASADPFFGETTESLEADVRSALGLLPDDPGDVLACGPEPMLEALRTLVPSAQLAWEAPMACGYGACYGCVVEQDGRFKRLCIDGPVLRAA